MLIMCAPNEKDRLTLASGRAPDPCGIVAELVALALGSLGHRVTQVRNGYTALTATDDIDVMLLDVMSPPCSSRSWRPSSSCC